MTVKYVKTMSEVRACKCDIMITNYERVRDGEDGVRIEPSFFTVTSLDEASVLRGFGTKTYQEFLPLFADVPFRFVATATSRSERQDTSCDGIYKVFDNTLCIHGANSKKTSTTKVKVFLLI